MFKLTSAINYLFSDVVASPLCRDARNYFAGNAELFILSGKFEFGGLSYDKNVGRSRKEERKAKEGRVGANRSRKYGTSQERDKAEIHKGFSSSFCNDV